MKTTNHMPFKLLRKALLSLAVLGFLAPAMQQGGLLHAQERTETIRHSKTFGVGPGTRLEIQNKYGKISLQTWEKNEVSFEVEVKLTESSSSKLRKLREDIHIEFSSKASSVMGHTVIDSESSRISSEIKSIGSTISGSNKRVEINYLVKLPAYMDVRLINKFGDIYMDDIEGTVDIALSNGVLKANDLKGHSKLDLNFANAMLKDLGVAEVHLSYSDLSMDNASQLDLESKSSKLNADSINILNITARRDKLYVKKVEYLHGNSSFSEIWIYDFLKECDLYMKYGKLTLEQISRGFENIQVESDNADLLLYLEPGSSFSYDILRSDKTDLRLPQGSDPSESRTSNDYVKLSGNSGEEAPGGSFHIDAHQRSFVQIAFK